MQQRPSRSQSWCRPVGFFANARKNLAFRRTCGALSAGLWLLCAACAEPSYKDSRGQAEAAPDGGGVAALASDGAVTSLEAGPAKTGRDADGPSSPDAKPSEPNDGAPTEPPIKESPSLVDASLANDATAPEPAPDASLVAPATPSWAPSLDGRFAMQVFTYSAEGNVISTGRARSLVDVRKTEAGTEMIVQACDDYSSSSVGTVQIAHPEKLSPQRYIVRFQPDSFYTEPVETALGYEVVPPPACDGKPGQRVEKRPLQTWITGSTCMCPGEKLPAVDDCRVIDSDGDKLPGYTVIGSAFGLAGAEVYGVTLGVSKFLNGRPGASGGFIAQQQNSVSSLQYGCRPVGCANLSGTSNGCGAAQSEVLLAPLAGRAEPSGGWTCAALLSRTGELFPGLPPATPASCTP